MNVTITCRHFESTEAIKEHVENKLEKFKKYLIRPIEVHVILAVEKFRQQCEITMHAKDFKAQALESSENMYTSIDMAIHKIERQIRKHKEIIRNHKDHLPLHQTSAMAEEIYEEELKE